MVGTVEPLYKFLKAYSPFLGLSHPDLPTPILPTPTQASTGNHKALHTGLRCRRGKALGRIKAGAKNNANKHRLIKKSLRRSSGDNQVMWVPPHKG